MLPDGDELSYGPPFSGVNATPRSCALPSPTRPRSRGARLRRLGQALLEAPDLTGVARLLTQVLPGEVGLPGATLLVFDRKLETFQAVSTCDARLQAAAPVADPGDHTRYLLSGGALIDTGRGEPGVLVPLLARSGLVGTLVLQPRARGGAPLGASAVPALTEVAAQAALALENALYQRELVASERMAALGTMAGMLAHDFRGPMTLIKGYAELIARSEVTDAVRVRAETIMAAVDRMERMTRETLDFARGGARLVLRPLPAGELLTDLADGIAQELPRLEVVRHFDALPDVTVRIDVDKLRRVVSNMAANSHDAMGGKGRFHLTAEMGDAPRADGVISPWLVLMVADEGPGIPAELRSSLFDPFVTHGKRGGTGLGLAVAKGFVEDHGGTLQLMDRAPGAHFRIALPLEPRA